MMLPREPSAAPRDQAVLAVHGEAASWNDIERRLAPYFMRTEPRQRALAYLRGLLSPAERKHSWQLAEVMGDATPDGFQPWLRRADWEADAVRDELRTSSVDHLRDPEAVLVIDETGFLKKGHHSAGVARQYGGTAGNVENCHIGVFLGDASRLGQAWLDRELYLPQEWTTDPARCRQAAIPEARQFATKPQLARQLLARAFAVGVPARWVTGDRGYGADRRLRLWLEAQPQAYVLAVSSQEYVWLEGRQRQVKAVLAALPATGWTRLSAGAGAQGPRWYDWCWMRLADPLEPGWRRWLLVRRSISTSTELTASVVCARDDTMVDEVVRVAGMRWTIESDFEATKSEVGLDHSEVRSWTGWYRHMTLAMWALALLTVLRAGVIALEAVKKVCHFPKWGAVWQRSKPAVASSHVEHHGDSPAVMALGPRRAADCPAHGLLGTFGESHEDVLRPHMDMPDASGFRRIGVISSVCDPAR